MKNANAQIVSAQDFNVVKSDARAGGSSSAIRSEVTELFSALRDQVYRQALRVTRAPAEAEDIAQEAFLRLYVHRRNGGKIDNPRAWLLRTACNLAIDRTRFAKLSSAGDEMAAQEESLPAQSENPEHVLLDRERKRSVEAMLGSLSPQERRCMELRTEGLRYREIASILGLRISTVQTNLCRAIRKIVERLDA